MKEHKNEIILSAIGLVLIGVFIFFMIRSRNHIEQYSFSKNEEIYYYIDDTLMEYKGKVVLDRNNKVTNISADESDWKTISEPIYYKNEEKVIFPNSMSLVRPTLGFKQNRLNYFTVLQNTPTNIKISNTDVDMSISNAFLFDGVNTYFFIDNVKLEYNDKTIDLPRFSYVRCGYKDYLYIYNYETKEMTADTEANYLVFASTAGYKINLSTDNLSVGENSFVLAKDVEKLPIIK